MKLKDDLRNPLLHILREARAMVYRDAESFDQATAKLELVGQLLCGKVLNGLGDYETEIIALASLAPNTEARHLRKLFGTIRTTRNDSVHTGAFIRHHGLKLVELLLYLEEAISMQARTAADLMVRSPMVAELWWTVAMVRTAMLANSYSYLPIETKPDEWQFIADDELVRFLNGFQNSKRRDLLGRTIKSIPQNELKLLPAEIVEPTCLIEQILAKMDHQPLLVMENVGEQKRLVGIITAFDLL